MRRSVFLTVAVAVALSLMGSAQQVGPNINMAAGSDIYLQRQNELAVGVSSVNPDHMIAFWNDWRTIDQALDMGAGTASQTILARLFHLPKKRDAKPAEADAAEGWTAVGISNNGGWNWSTGLVPGSPGDISAEGAALRAGDYEAMADPWVSCGPMHCHVVTVAFTRGGASALVYFRYSDLNKSETSHNWKMTVPPTILRTANNSLPGQFNDKPVIIAGPNGQVLIGSVEFDGQDKGGKFQSKVLVTRSADNGQTWSAFQKISQTSGRNQSPFFVIDPNNPARIFAAWRVFGDSSIVSRTSLDGGASWIGNKPATVLTNLQAYDQVGQQMPLQQQFRTNAYATGAMDGSGVLHVAVAERVNAAGAPSATGTPRIVMTSSYDGGLTWTARRPVAMSATGPQFMPTLTIVGAPKLAGDPAGKTRAEIFLAYYGADPADIPANSPGPIAGGNVRFHMYLSHADTWNVNAAGQVNFDAAKRVSRYQMDAFNPGNVVTGAGFGVTSENRGYAIFYGGTGGFTGDYNIVTPRVPYVKTKTGGWRATTALDEDPATIELPSPSVQIAWADTRDLILPTSPAPYDPLILDSYAWYNYSPPGTGAVSACNAGSRNQNPYTAEATMGVLAAAPLTFKDPNLPRSYPLYVQNKTAENQLWRATIDSAALASFNYPFPNAVPKQEVDFVLRSYSTVTGTVFVNQTYSAPFQVRFQRLDGTSGLPLSGPGTFTAVTLNTTGGTDPAAATQELHDPLIATDILVFTHPKVNGTLPIEPYVQESSDNPTPAPLGQNPLGQNPLGQNPFGQNPLGQNTAPEDITDYTYRIQNGGTTHSAYKALVDLQQQLDPTLYKFQVIVNRVTHAPGLIRGNCALGSMFQPIQISNVESPLGQNPLGQNPLGQNPFGQNPLGQNSLGQNPFGQNPLGQNPLGQNALASDDTYSTFYVAPSPTSPSAALNKSQLQWARSTAQPSGGGRYVRVGSTAEYLKALSAPVNFSLGDRPVDEVWWTLRVSQLRPFTIHDVRFKPEAISLAVISTAPNVKLINGEIIVTDPPAAFKAPDLVYASSLTGIPASTAPGWPITLPAMTAQNAGNASAVPFNQALYLRSAQFPDGVFVGEGAPTVGTLQPGASVSVAGAVLTIPPTLPAGSYDACAVLDRTNVVAESRENNNFTCVPLELRAPDLQVAVARSPANPTTVDAVTFTATVTNAGAGSALASTLSFPLPGDEGSTTFAVPVLAPGASYQVTRTRSFGTGTYTRTVTADVNDVVAESNENNNQADNSFTVIPPYLRFTTQPTNALVGNVISPAVTAAVTNGFGQTVTGFVGDITVDVLNNPAPRLMLGTVTKPASNGVATFNDLYFTRFGTYNLVASSPGLTSATSTAFSISDLSVLNTDVAYAGYGGMRGNGTGSIVLQGVSGTVTKAVLYWHGPTNSTSPTVNATVTFNGTSITGTNIGFAHDNLWFDNNVEFANSQAYRADVSSLVTGNGTYSLANFRKTHVTNNVTVVDADINGASLIVFFDDGNPSNNKNVYFRNINDSNKVSAYDDADWSQTLGGVAYSGGPAKLVLHVGDGQYRWNDAAVLLNGVTIASTGQIFDGSSVPSNGGSTELYGGSLWDIKPITIPEGVLSPTGQNTLTITTGYNQDALSLVVMMIIVDR
jgi:hypothetical protein